MRFTRSLLLSVALAGLLIGCNTDTDEPPGTLILRILTSGQALDVDADGYQVDGLPGGPVDLAINDTLEIELPAGQYTLVLTGVAGNCTPAPTQLVVKVRADKSTAATWDLVCGVIPGQASVIFDPGSSTGSGAVTFSIDGLPAQPIAPGATIDLGDLEPGAHQLSAGIGTPNCRVSSGGSQPFTVTRNQLTTVVVIGYCSAGTIVFDENVTEGNTNFWTMYRMNADSSGLQAFSGAGVDGGTHPALSPDGSKVAYITSYDSLMVMNADGANPTLVVQVLNAQGPVWSPDGNRIAFAAAGGNPYEIYVVDADGMNLTNITNDPSNDYNPSWSADGTTIVFASERSGSPNIYRAAPDGSLLDTLTTSGADHPSWSPDGSLIAFVAGQAVWLMGPDGSNAHALTGTYGGSIGGLAWSPDGRFIVFYSNGLGLVYAPTDGLSPVTVSRMDPGSASYQVSWNP